MPEPTQLPNHYAVLGLAPDATADDIKAAYRAAAKRAHPDAGGSPEAMAAVNEAHRILADPDARLRYDHDRAAPPPHAAPADPQHAQSPHDQHHATDRTASHHRADAPQHGHHDPQAFHRMRRSQARRNALQIIQRSLIAAILLGLITRYFNTLATDETTRIMLKILGFIPIYGIILGCIFVVSPQIRLDLFDVVQYLLRRGPQPQLDRLDRITLIALALGIVPLSIAWIGLT